MKKSVFALTGAILFAATTALASDEFIADCEEFKEANSVEGDCACMAEAVASDDDLASEIMAMESLDDFDGLSDAAKAIVEDCGE